MQAFLLLLIEKRTLFIRVLHERTGNMQFACRLVLYLDLYLPCLLGDDASIREPFMPVKHLVCVLVHISEIGAVKHVSVLQ